MALTPLRILWLLLLPLLPLLPLTPLLALPTAALESDDFFAEEPGSSRTYLDDGVSLNTEEVQPGTVLVNGVLTREIRVVAGPEAGYAEFWTNDAEGWRVHRADEVEVDEFDLDYVTPYRALPGVFDIGDRFTQTAASVDVLGPGGPYPFRYDADSTVVGVEAVTVPAGTFVALVVDRRLDFEGSIGEEDVRSSETSREWLVRHLGSVRSEGQSDGEPFLSELDSHTLTLCGDVSGDGVVGLADLDLLREALVGDATLGAAALERCRTVAQDPPCTVLDAIVLERELRGPLLGPGTSRACVAP